MPIERSDFIRNAPDLPDNGGTVWPGSDEVLSARTELSRPLGLLRLGVHYERLPPGRRTSLPHAEAEEEECVYVLEGHPEAWIDDERFPLGPGDFVAFVPGTGIRHTISNPSDTEVRLLVVGERACAPKREVDAFLAWLAEERAHLGPPHRLSSDALLAMAIEHRGERLARSPGHQQAWRVAFIDHVFRPAATDAEWGES